MAVAIGVPLTLYLWFTIAYFLKFNLQDFRLAVVLVTFNIVLWAVISLILLRNRFGLEILSFRSPLRTLLVGLAVSILLGIMSFLFNFFKSKGYEYPSPYHSVPFFISFVVCSVLEEVIWRAYVLRSIGFNYLGLIVSSLFFGLHHIGLSFKNFVFATMAGLVLGVAYMRTELFWGVALGHVFYNLFFHQIFDYLWRLIFK